MPISPASLGWFFVVLSVAACGGRVIGERRRSPDDRKDASGEGGSAGRTNTGGVSHGAGRPSTGGVQSSSGGVPSSEGGASTGGFDMGGAGGGSSMCDPESVSNHCMRCVELYCCQEYTDCIDVRCAGTDATGSDGELVCMQDCLINGFAGLDGGATSLSVCADKCKGPNAALATTTTAAISCMTAPVDGAGSSQRCSDPCFGGDVM